MQYRISGVWKDGDGVITHYAVHQYDDEYLYRAEKMTKADAVKLVSDKTNQVWTWMWNYKTADWALGAIVTVVPSKSGPFLRSVHDNTERDNLWHLIDYDWIRK